MLMEMVVNLKAAGLEEVKRRSKLTENKCIPRENGLTSTP